MNPTSPRRALIVIDVQNEYVSGGLRIEHPPVASSLAAIGRAMDHAAAHGIPVVVVQNHAPAGAPLFALGSRGWELHEVVAGRPRDLLVDKTLPSAFAGTGLRDWLARHGIDTICIAGYMTHNCDAATAVDATQAGLAVEFLEDASGSVSYSNAAGFASARDIHRVFGVVLHSRFAAVVSTAEWMRAVTSRRRLERGSIHASHAAAVSQASSAPA